MEAEDTRIILAEMWCARYSCYHQSYQYLCDCSLPFSLTIIHYHYLLMDNQRSIQSAKFDLLNTSFGIDVVHTYDGIDVKA